jgi:hypothetical protein
MLPLFLFIFIYFIIYLLFYGSLNLIPLWLIEEYSNLSASDLGIILPLMLEALPLKTIQ